METVKRLIARDYIKHVEDLLMCLCVRVGGCGCLLSASFLSVLFDVAK